MADYKVWIANKAIALGRRSIEVNFLIGYVTYMSTPSREPLNAKSARQLLGTFSCIESKIIESASEKALIYQAIFLFNDLADYINLGICADTAAEGLLALESYIKALGFEVSINREEIASFETPVYIKFNGQKQTYYLDFYTGKYRGVLISCQSSEDESINGTYGYFPLDLFVSKEGIEAGEKL